MAGGVGRVGFQVDGRPGVRSLSSLRSRLANWIAVVTLTFVLGGHWAILQSVAWLTMVAGYSQTDPLKQALVKTFDGDHPCPLCLFVAKGKKAEQKQDTQKLLVKLDLFAAAAPALLWPPAKDPLGYPTGPAPSDRILSPPVPPPRSFH